MRERLHQRAARSCSAGPCAPRPPSRRPPTAEAVEDRLELVVHIDTHRAFNDGHHRQLSPVNFGVTAVLQKQ
jgi:hypothetical protein